MAAGHRVAVLLREAASHDLPAGLVVVPLAASDAEVAQQLYAALRQVDQQDCDTALTTLPAERGIGVAIADRLRKAAGPREAD